MQLLFHLLPVSALAAAEDPIILTTQLKILKVKSVLHLSYECRVAPQWLRHFGHQNILEGHSDPRFDTKPWYQSRKARKGQMLLLLLPVVVVVVAEAVVVAVEVE